MRRLLRPGKKGNMAKKAKKKAVKKGTTLKKSAPKKGKSAVKERPATLTIAALLFFLSAVINLLSFTFLLFLEPAKLQLLGDAAKLIVIIPGVLGLLDFFSAYGLWKMRLYGGVVGIIDIIASILVGYYQQPGYDAVSLIILGVNIFLFVLIVTNWKKLE